MRAAYFEAFQSITVRDAPVPEPGPGEVLLDVRYCGICGSDVTCYKTGALAGPGVVLGHEVSATVDLDPSGRWARGTRVAVFPSGNGCGTCVWCREGKRRYCLNPPDRPIGGGFASSMAVPADDLIALSDDLDDRAAALAEPLGVALRAVGMAAPAPGDLAYVSGLGSLGLLAAAALAEAGCRVVGGDPRRDRRAFGEDLGCEATLDPTRQDPTAVTLGIDPHGPRVALECAGVPDSLQQAFEACGPAGVVGILGIPMAPVFLLRMTLKEQRAFSLQGPTYDSMRRAVELLRRRARIAKIITGTVPLERTNEAFSSLASGDGGIKVLVEPER